MPANVETMMYQGATPWHGIGTPIDGDDVYDIERCIVSAGLDWEVELQPIFLSDGREVPDGQATVRASDKSILGVVGPRFTPVQNKRAFEWFSPWLETRQAALHTAGSLNEGRRVWILAKLNLDNGVVVKGDEVEKYVLLSHSHDGTLAMRLGYTPVRVVCANTLAMAHGSDASKLIRLRHTKNIHQNMSNVRDVMNVANAEFEATLEQYRLLVRRDINQADLKKYIKAVFKMDEREAEAAKVGKKLSTRSSNILERVAELFDSGKGNQLPGVRGTLWAAYNGVTQYLDWERGHNDNSRVNSMWFGDSALVNARAMEQALAMAV